MAFRFFLLLFLFTQSAYCEIKEWKLQDIPLAKCTIIKKIPLHTVYQYENYYIKIWEENTRNMLNNRNTDFYLFAKKGALNNIVPLKAVIIDKNDQCCGYVTYPCEILNIDIAAIKNGKKTGHPHETAVRQLFSNMQKSTLHFGVCFNDVSSGNLGFYNGKYYYFDLDGIWSLSKLKENFHEKWTEILFYLDEQFSDSQVH